MKGFVCVDCKQPVAWHRNQWTIRLEVRSMDSKTRMHVQTISHVCTSCARERVKAMKNESPDLQEVLF